MKDTDDFDDDKLKLIGWAGRKTSIHLTPPGQTRLLEVPRGARTEWSCGNRRAKGTRIGV